MGENDKDYHHLYLHNSCPIHDLLKCIPSTDEVVQLYFRCKLCPQAKVYISVESFLQHVQGYHAHYYMDHTTKTMNEDEITIVISSDQVSQETTQPPEAKRARTEVTQSNLQQQPLHVEATSANYQQNSSLTGHVQNAINNKTYETSLEPPSYDKTTRMHVAQQQKQPHICESNCSVLNQPTYTQTTAVIHSQNTEQLSEDQSNLVNSQSTSGLMQVLSEQTSQLVKNQPINQLHSLSHDQMYQIAIQQANVQAGGENNHMIDAIFPGQINDSSGSLTYQQFAPVIGTDRQNVTAPGHVILQTGTDSLVKQQRMPPNYKDKNPVVIDKGNGTVIVSSFGEMTPVSVSIAPEMISSIRSPLQSQQHQSDHILSPQTMSTAHQVSNSLKKTAVEGSIQQQQQRQSQPKRGIIKIERVQEILEKSNSMSGFQQTSTTAATSTSTTASATTQISYQQENNLVSQIINSSIPTTSIKELGYDDNEDTESKPSVCIINSFDDEILQRGRPLNKPVDTIAKYELPLSALFASGILHKGPLHHKDRVQEALIKCPQTNPSDCRYLVLGTHYHCRACRGIVREEDLITHRYSHSSIRLITDVNLHQVVNNGKFCEDVECQNKNTGNSTSDCNSVIHMHCNHCEDILETGYRFHQHLKHSHPAVWASCQVYEGSNTDSEQCLLCRGYFGSQEYLTKHMTDRHFAKYRIKEMQSSVLICCNEEFPQLEPYKIHMAVHHKTLAPSLFKPASLPHRCLECGEDFIGKQSIYKHHWMVHKSSISKKCTVSETSFSSPQELQVHIEKRHKMS